MKDLINDGYLDIRTTKAAKAYKVLQNYDLAFDIGTNVGGFSNAYHNKFNKIIAIEAHPLTYDFAKKNLAKHKNIEVINKAVSNVSDEEINLYLHSSGDSGSTSMINLNNFNQEEDNVHKVKTISFNDLVNKYGVPQYIKIDCEGGEYNFLMNQDLSGIEFMAIELHYDFLTPSQHSELLNYLLKFFNIHSQTHGKPGRNHPEYNLIKK